MGGAAAVSLKRDGEKDSLNLPVRLAKNPNNVGVTPPTPEQYFQRLSALSEDNRNQYFKTHHFISNAYLDDVLKKIEFLNGINQEMERSEKSFGSAASNHFLKTLRGEASDLNFSFTPELAKQQRLQLERELKEQYGLDLSRLAETEKTLIQLRDASNRLIAGKGTKEDRELFYFVNGDASYRKGLKVTDQELAATLGTAVLIKTGSSLEGWQKQIGDFNAKGGGWFAEKAQALMHGNDAKRIIGDGMEKLAYGTFALGATAGGVALVATTAPVWVLGLTLIAGGFSAYDTVNQMNSDNGPNWKALPVKMTFDLLPGASMKLMGKVAQIGNAARGVAAVEGAEAAIEAGTNWGRVGLRAGAAAGVGAGVTAVQEFMVDGKISPKRVALAATMYALMAASPEIAKLGANGWQKAAAEIERRTPDFYKAIEQISERASLAWQNTKINVSDLTAGKLTRFFNRNFPELSNEVRELGRRIGDFLNRPLFPQGGGMVPAQATAGRSPRISSNSKKDGSRIPPNAFAQVNTTENYDASGNFTGKTITTIRQDPPSRKEANLAFWVATVLNVAETTYDLGEKTWARENLFTGILSKYENVLSGNVLSAERLKRETNRSVDNKIINDLSEALKSQYFTLYESWQISESAKIVRSNLLEASRIRVINQNLTTDNTIKPLVEDAEKMHHKCKEVASLDIQLEMNLFRTPSGTLEPLSSENRNKLQNDKSVLIEEMSKLKNPIKSGFADFINSLTQSRNSKRDKEIFGQDSGSVVNAKDVKDGDISSIGAALGISSAGLAAGAGFVLYRYWGQLNNIQRGTLIFLALGQIASSWGTTLYRMETEDNRKPAYEGTVNALGTLIDEKAKNYKSQQEQGINSLAKLALDYRQELNKEILTRRNVNAVQIQESGKVAAERILQYNQITLNPFIKYATEPLAKLKDLYSRLESIPESSPLRQSILFDIAVENLSSDMYMGIYSSIFSANSGK
jgi:hypothetical protein